MKKRIMLTIVLTLLALMLASTAALAHGAAPGEDKTSTATSCGECHGDAAKHTSGPHGGYTNSTDKCQICHNLHSQGAGAEQGAQNAVLLMGTTVTAACQFCHNLTSSEYAPYNMTGGMTAAAGHRVVGVDFGTLRSDIPAGDLTIPGGAVDGGNGTLDVSAQGKLSGQTFTCNSCHTPHGVNTVQTYIGESETKHSTYGGGNRLYATNRILKNKPNGTAEAITAYGSAWCAACHQGRTGTPEGHVNHPVDMSKPAYQFLELAGLDSSSIVNGVFDAATYGDIRTNKQYAMTTANEVMADVYGNPTPFADGNVDISAYTSGPTCQQCHASSRDLSQSFAAEANPARGNFPHVSDKPFLLIQDESDAFCANCHAPSVLP